MSFLGDECLLATKRTVLVPNRHRVLPGPALAVVVLAVKPELVVVTINPVDEDGPGVLFSGALLPLDGEAGLGGETIAAGVEVA